MMKTAIAIFFAAALCCSVHATTCGNNSQGGGAPPCPVGGDSGGKKKCNDPDGPGSDPCTGSSVTPYTGNERHVVEDLKVWGSIGEQPLVWARYYNSRAVISNNIFGNNQTWRHGYEWETSVAYEIGSLSPEHRGPETTLQMASTNTQPPVEQLRSPTTRTGILRQAEAGPTRTTATAG